MKGNAMAEGEPGEALSAYEPRLVVRAGRFALFVRELNLIGGGDNLDAAFADLVAKHGRLVDEARAAGLLDELSAPAGTHRRRRYRADWLGFQRRGQGALDRHPRGAGEGPRPREGAAHCREGDSLAYRAPSIRSRRIERSERLRICGRWSPTSSPMPTNWRRSSMPSARRPPRTSPASGDRPGRHARPLLQEFHEGRAKAGDLGGACPAVRHGPPSGARDADGRRAVSARRLSVSRGGRDRLSPTSC